eukprot:2003312-Rhodomonas_salina.6
MEHNRDIVPRHSSQKQQLAAINSSTASKNSSASSGYGGKWRRTVEVEGLLALFLLVMMVPARAHTLAQYRTSRSTLIYPSTGHRIAAYASSYRASHSTILYPTTGHRIARAEGGRRVNLCMSSSDCLLAQSALSLWVRVVDFGCGSLDVGKSCEALYDTTPTTTTTDASTTITTIDATTTTTTDASTTTTATTATTATNLEVDDRDHVLQPARYLPYSTAVPK